MRSGYLCSALALALFGTAAPAMTAPSPDRSHAREQASAPDWQQVGEAFSRGDCATVLRLIPLQPKDPVAGADNERMLSASYELAGICAWRAHDLDLAHRYAMQGTALGAASDSLWRMRILLELETARDAPAVTTIEMMARGHLAALDTISVRWLMELSGRLKRGHQDDVRKRLLTALLDKGYTPPEPLGTVDYFRQDYAAMLYAAGDKAGAAALVRKIEEPSIETEMSLDDRFRAMLPADFDPRAGVERSLARARAAMQQHPELIEPMADAARRLLKLGRPQEALAVLETARARIGNRDGFADASTKANWWWDELAGSYTMLGRYDDAVAALRAGSQAGEEGGLNVSQTINLADLQINFGKGALALDTLKPFSMVQHPLSPFGEMALRYSRGCANALVGHKDAITDDLVFVRAHDADNRHSLINLQLCMGDLDGAAASIVRQLDDPDRRTAMLVELSDYDEPPVTLPDYPQGVNWEKVKARADVKAAIARAGGTRRIHLQAGEF